MRRSFKYRLYPTREKVHLLRTWLDLCRELYNAALEERREAWKRGVSVHFPDQSRQLPEIKKIRPDLGQVNAQVLQNVLHRVDDTFQRFFDRVRRSEKPGYPRFKGRDCYQSLTWPQSTAFSLVGAKRLRLSCVGELRIKLHRPLEGRPKTCTVKCEAGKWYAIFSQDKVPSRAYPQVQEEVGIDMGLERFITLSTGEKIENPRWYRRTEERLIKAQKDLSRKKRGSRRRDKAKLRLARQYEKVRHQREDFHHRTAYRLVKDYSFLAIEDLSIKGFLEKCCKGLSKSIHDAAWGAFLRNLAGKAEEAGRRLVKVPPEGTSSQCSGCGSVRPKGLAERVHECPCGLVLDRDHNAARNILRLGRSLQAEA